MSQPQSIAGFPKDALSGTLDNFSLETPILTTERLVMRRPQRDDIDALTQLANDPDIAMLTSRLPYPYLRQDAENFVDAIESGQAVGHIYAITLGTTGRLIGMCSVERRARSNGLEVGYWIGKNWWGQGYATEASRAVIDLSFKVTGADQIFAACRVNNLASRRVLFKQGFIFAGMDETNTAASGRVPIERYRLTREEWLNHLIAAEAGK